MEEIITANERGYRSKDISITPSMIQKCYDDIVSKGDNINDYEEIKYMIENGGFTWYDGTHYYVTYKIK